MTDLGLNYLKHVEEQRHNREMERLTGEKQAEDKRANMAREAENAYYNQTYLGELQRHQIAQELETNRANTLDAEVRKYTSDNSLAGTKYTAKSNQMQTLWTNTNKTSLEKLREGHETRLQEDKQAHEEAMKVYDRGTQITTSLISGLSKLGGDLIKAKSSAQSSMMNAAAKLIPLIL